MNITIQEMMRISIFAALTAVGAFLKIQTPLVPFTLQFLFCAYAGIFLGARNGFYSQFLYVIIGLLGIPIFANGGGPSYVLQPTFGYLLGFLPCAYIIGRLCEKLSRITFIKIFAVVLLGLSVIYVFGVSYLYFIVKFYLHKEMTVSAALTAGFLPYITADLILGILIAITAVRIIPRTKQHFQRNAKN